MIGAPSAPYETGALLAMAATRIAFEVGDAERNQDRRHHRPRIAETDQALEQCAEGPREQHGLYAYVHAAQRDQPAAEILEHAAHPQRVEQHHAPDGDPVDVPHAGRRPVQVGVRAVVERHPPYPGREREGDDRADQRREPRREAEHRQHDQQRDHGNQRHQAGERQVVERVDHLREHDCSLEVRRGAWVLCVGVAAVFLYLRLLLLIQQRRLQRGLPFTT